MGKPQRLETDDKAQERLRQILAQVQIRRLLSKERIRRSDLDEEKARLEAQIVTCGQAMRIGWFPFVLLGFFAMCVGVLREGDRTSGDIVVITTLTTAIIGVICFYAFVFNARMRLSHKVEVVNQAAQMVEAETGR